MISIRPVVLPIPGLQSMTDEAAAEDFEFLDRLIDEWQSGANRFDGPGETLLGVFHEDTLVGIGGLNRDPFLGNPAVGRIRRIYIRAAWRNFGVGTDLVTALLARAQENFEQVRLRAVNPSAGRLYERLGFQPIDDAHATHALILNPRSQQKKLTHPLCLQACASGSSTLAKSPSASR
jgi:GNAT superfamily N-acetyltransferase